MADFKISASPGGALTAANSATGDIIPVVDVSVGASDNANVYMTRDEFLKLMGVHIQPGGRLTLVTATPVLTSDQTAKTSVYYTPYVSDQIPLYNAGNTTWLSRTFSELTLSLDTSNHLLGTIYDVFVWDDAGTIKIGTGPAWSNTATVTMTIASPCVVSWTGHGLIEGDRVVFTTTGALPTGITAGTTYFVGKSPGANSFNVATTLANASAGTYVNTSGSQSGTHTGTNGTRSRGTGAGTTELEQINGRWTNKNSITLKNGAGAGTSGIAANTALYVGSIYCTANGQTGMSFEPAAASGGTNNILAVFNAYNRVPTIARCRNSVGTYSYGTAAYRILANSLSERISYIDGLAVSSVVASVHGYMVPSTAAAYIGFQRNSTAASADYLVAAVPSGSQSVTGHYPPRIGLNYVQGMEYGNASAQYNRSATEASLNITLPM